ncbi:hypothetical protein FO440_00070 [Mucilaginibacter corticis]|uniref:Signal transduction histidine kinase internal region domain-containing protein n=1 Tax=Mucilaginibacter corticis TaxID=2597670 RepID=A0A556MRT8_9SPHI|nr:sensor histidine kinase [Mucilaginibacter corticis]TSJ42623.1 hypothetical protein FO440_00070 [Mucilaginibacter corticis]
MKYFRFARWDYLVLVLSVYPFMIIVAYLILGDDYFTPVTFFYATLLALPVSTASWVTHIMTANFLRDLLPSHTSTTKRILIQLPIYFILTQIGICFGTYLVFHLVHLAHEPMSWQSFKPLIYAGFILNVIATSSHEGMILFDKWKISLVETEQLKKINLQRQLDSLKSQVNPHFLFNSLNCLSALINTDPPKASEFLDEMSKVYRYLLRSNDTELTTLTSELQFAHSFFHMLKTRYGGGIALHVDVNQDYNDYLLPPLTLQLLIENAVKHNMILKDQPLIIKVFTSAGGVLTVTNNLQKKNSKILSNKVGLQNIATKYQLLHHVDIDIKNGPDDFSVTVPLIKNQVYESINS